MDGFKDTATFSGVLPRARFLGRSEWRSRLFVAHVCDVCSLMKCYLDGAGLIETLPVLSASAGARKVQEEATFLNNARGTRRLPCPRVCVVMFGMLQCGCSLRARQVLPRLEHPASEAAVCL